MNVTRKIVSLNIKITKQVVNLRGELEITTQVVSLNNKN